MAEPQDALRAIRAKDAADLTHDERVLLERLTEIAAERDALRARLAELEAAPSLEASQDVVAALRALDRVAETTFHGGLYLHPHDARAIRDHIRHVTRLYQRAEVERERQEAEFERIERALDTCRSDLAADVERVVRERAEAIGDAEEICAALVCAETEVYEARSQRDLALAWLAPAMQAVADTWDNLRAMRAQWRPGADLMHAVDQAIDHERVRREAAESERDDARATLASEHNIRLAGDAVLERIEGALGAACTGDLAADVGRVMRGLHEARRLHASATIEHEATRAAWASVAREVTGDPATPPERVLADVQRVVRERDDLARQAQLFRGALSGTMDTGARGYDAAVERGVRLGLEAAASKCDEVAELERATPSGFSTVAMLRHAARLVRGDFGSGALSPASIIAAAREREAPEADSCGDPRRALASALAYLCGDPSSEERYAAQSISRLASIAAARLVEARDGALTPPHIPSCPHSDPAYEPPGDDGPHTPLPGESTREERELEARSQRDLAMTWGADLARQAQLFRGALSGTMDTAARGHDAAVERGVRLGLEAAARTVDEVAELERATPSGFSTVAMLRHAARLLRGYGAEALSPAAIIAAAREREAPAQDGPRERFVARAEAAGSPASSVLAGGAAVPATCGDCSHARRNSMISERVVLCTQRGDDAPWPAFRADKEPPPQCPLRAQETVEVRDGD